MQWEMVDLTLPVIGVSQQAQHKKLLIGVDRLVADYPRVLLADSHQCPD